MITGLDHIAIIVSSEFSVDFYKHLGFQEIERKDRGFDTIVILNGYGVCLELFVDSTHPARLTNPETNGLRHLALKVDSIENTVKEFGIETEQIREINGKRFTFFKDPDGLPIELHE